MSSRWSRRSALVAFNALAARVRSGGQYAPEVEGEPEGRIAPVAELVNAFEFEPMAERSLSAALFDEIRGTEREALERITFRPRLMVNTEELDLTCELLGKRMFAPIVAASTPGPERFREGGAAELTKGAADARAVLIRGSVQDGTAPEPGYWGRLYPGEVPIEAETEASAIVLSTRDSGARWDWGTIGTVRKSATAPLVLDGVMDPAEAQTATDQGIDAIIVSNRAGPEISGLAEPLAVLPAIATAIDGAIPILVEGGCRRGSDVLKAVALGATAMVVTRPTMWGLAAYGAKGVQTVIELMQTELARDMAMCGAATLADISRDMVKIHSR